MGMGGGGGTNTAGSDIEVTPLIDESCHPRWMAESRQLPLLDATLGTWHERMAGGEYAVHYSSVESGNPYCTVFETLQDAIAHGEEQVLKRPALRCMIYDHDGMVGAPIREIRGKDFKANEITSRFRRWFGSVSFLAGSILTIIDWSMNFRLSWPAMIGTRMALGGFTVLVIEGLVMLHERQSEAERKRSV
jgi:hypothetical protein